MVRKHTRRTARAAFAVSFGVALLIGLVAFGATAQSGVAGAKKTLSKPTVRGSYSQSPNRAWLAN